MEDTASRRQGTGTPRLGGTSAGVIPQVLHVNASVTVSFRNSGPGPSRA